LLREPLAPETPNGDAEGLEPLGIFGFISDSFRGFFIIRKAGV